MRYVCPQRPVAADHEHDLFEEILDELTFEILRVAVNVARHEQIRHLPALRDRLTQLYPDHQEQREAAISAWANNVRTRYPNGVPRHG